MEKIILEMEQLRKAGKFNLLSEKLAVFWESLIKFPDKEKNDTYYQQLLSHFHLQSQNYHQASIILKKLIEKNHTKTTLLISLFLQLNKVFYDWGKYEKVIKTSNELLKIFPYCSLAYQDKAMALINLQQYNEAQKEIVKAINTSPSPSPKMLSLLEKTK